VRAAWTKCIALVTRGSDATVAIKVLPETLARDTDRLRRFEQEARTIAALKHPNILAIHDIGTHEGASSLVSELLEGETLRTRLESGAQPERRVIEYALGIAAGVLGKLYAETTEELPFRPVEALRSLGARPVQLLLWAMWPQARPLLSS
jgi:serine/threonine protein kinase